VSLARAFIDRWHSLIRELTKFGIIGMFNTGLDFVIFNALFFAGPLRAQVAATVVSATSSYFMNRHWTFRHRARSGLRREYTLFFFFNGVGLAITLVILAAATRVFGIDDQLAVNGVKLLAIVAATLFRFWSYKRWVFLHPDHALFAPLDEEPEPVGR